MRIRLKGINKVRAKLTDGSTRVYYYHRSSGKRLEGEPGSPAFVRSVGLAEKNYSQRGREDLSVLIRLYENSGDFKKLAESTKDIAKFIHAKIEREFGDLTKSSIQERDSDGKSRVRVIFLRWHDDLIDDGARGADNTLSHLQRILSWAEYRGEIGFNPLSTFKRAWSSNRVDNIWLPEQIVKFMSLASEQIQACMMLALHTGQRKGDLIRLTWGAFDGSGIELRQGKSKRKKKQYIPCTKALKEFLTNMNRVGPLILTSPTGLAWSKSNLRDQWNDVADKAQIEDLHFHDLRGTAITMLAEAGCTVPEIASITGHSMKTVESILERYLARTKPLAINAIAKLDRYQNERAGDVP